MVERTSQSAITSLARRMREVDTGEVDDGFRMERSEDRRGRSLRRRRAGLAGAAFLLLAIKAIMRCHTIRVPTLKYDKTIQMLGIRLPWLTLPPPPSTAACVASARCPAVRILYIGKLGRVCLWFPGNLWKIGFHGASRICSVRE